MVKTLLHTKPHQHEWILNEFINVRQTAKLLQVPGLCLSTAYEFYFSESKGCNLLNSLFCPYLIF